MDDPQIPPPMLVGGSRWRLVAAWAVILLVVGFVMIAVAIPEIRGRKRPVANESRQFELSAKYLLGGASAFKGAPGGNEKTFIQSLDQSTKTTRERICAAIVAGEVLGREEALKRLTEIESGLAADDEPSRSQISDLRIIYNANDGGSPATKPAGNREEAAARLTEQLGWFGRLAASFGRPDGDPLRQSVLADATRTFFALLSFVVIVVGGIVVGLVLLIVGIILLATRHIRLMYLPDRSVFSAYLEGFAVYMASYVALSALVAWLFRGSSGLGSTWLLAVCVPITFFWIRRCGVSWSQLLGAIGWTGAQKPLLEPLWGIVGYFAGLPVVAMGFLVTFVLTKITGANPTHPIMFEATDSPLKILQLYGIACVFAPVIEETMFRGLLYGHLRKRWNWPVSGIITGFLFAAIHPQGWTLIPGLGSIGFMLASIREWRGSLIASMTAHAFNNAVVVTVLVMTR